MSVATKTIWRLSGEEVGSCNCAWGCPCQFNALPTSGRCEALILFQITRGHYGGTPLDGLKLAMIVSFPGPIHEGNGTRQIIIEDKSTPEQRKALLEITSGKSGGAYFEIFSAVCPTTLESVVVAPITLEVDREERTAKVRIPGIAEADVEPIKNPVTGEAHRARINLPFGFEYREAEMGNSVRWKVTSGAKVTMDHQNTYAQLNAFDWSNL